MSELNDTKFIDHIYEVTAGSEPKTSMRYTRGGEYMGGRVTVTAIIYDQNSYYTLGQRRVEIYAKKRGGEEFLWKILENLPLTITREVE